MAKRNRGMTKEAILKRWKEGYGQGESSQYKPWLTIQDVPSNGQVNRPLGWKTGRVHHLMSLNELRYFYLLEWSPVVADIREQFPLWQSYTTAWSAVWSGGRRYRNTSSTVHLRSVSPSAIAGVRSNRLPDTR